MALITEKTVYTRDVNYVKNVYITEYDLRSAGYSIIREYKLLDDNVIESLSKLEKTELNIAIGRIQRENIELINSINTHLTSLRNGLYIHNNLSEEDVLSIKRDAVFVMNKIPTVLKFGEYLEFVPKESFTSFIMLSGIELYYDSRTDNLVLKGFSNSERKMNNMESLDANTNPFFKYIKDILRKSEELPDKSMYILLKKFREDYLSKSLHKEVYRNVFTGLFDVDIVSSKKETELNKKIDVFDETTKTNQYEYEGIDDESIDIVDIGENYRSFILPLISLVL